MNTKPNSFYDLFLLERKKIFELSKAVSMGQHWEVNGQYYSRCSDNSDGVQIWMFDWFSSDVDHNMEQLVNVLKTLKSLRACIGLAAEASHLTSEELSALKLKLSAFDHESRYADATRLVRYALEYEPHLVNTKWDTWWDIGNDDLHKPTSTPKSLKQPATALGTTDKMRSTLTFIVPAISLLSTIPAAVAWKHDDATLDSSRDSNFWQAISASTMQLLGLITFIWPTLYNDRLSQFTWIWIWVLAAISALCAIFSVPLYLLCPTIWSFVVSFIGVVVQAVVQLQVVNAL
ncbi:hypothetical protein BDW02DRAFT_571940 [Decorospora gaudefroyi]|uniref:Uncharacterized protein n=1 Tax=Decorospora gaudefroyi TaxID=184978 RepID=A0A6A5KDK1_9PLEO|nr:hypothetical protein BDW02DRAFT_571940 [Decorospora gaudefroyi]